MNNFYRIFKFVFLSLCYFYCLSFYCGRKFELSNLRHSYISRKSNATLITDLSTLCYLKLLLCGLSSIHFFYALHSIIATLLLLHFCIMNLFSLLECSLHNLSLDCDSISSGLTLFY